jgi:hypothetical protein
MTFRFIRPSSAVLLAAAALAAAPARADDAPRFAWGKAGVSYETYRAEAYDCALYGLSIDVAHTAPVEQLRKASRQMEALDAQKGGAGSADPIAEGIRYAQETAAVRAAARPEKQVQAVKEIMFSAMQRCMAAHGYIRFALTEAQRGEMDALHDAQERRVFLHKLASDAAVLEQQRQPLAP